MLFRYLSIFLLCTLASCGTEVNRYSAQNLTCIQVIDRNELSETIGTKDRLKKYQSTDFSNPQPYQQVLRVFNKDESGKTPSIITSYHPNGQIWKYLEVLDARAFGLYQEWFENGQTKIKATVIGGSADLSPSAQKEWLFDEKCFVWDEKGYLVAEIPYEKGVLQGVAFHKHRNGEIAKIVPYEKNQLHGEFAEFNEEGHPISKIQFSNDLKHGDALRYWEMGTLSSLEVYQSGLLKTGSYFTPDGTKISEVKDGLGKQAVFQDGYLAKLLEYKHGKPDGLIECFDSSGYLASSYQIKNGIKEGIETIYFHPDETDPSINTPMSKMTLEWKNDQIHGMVKTWYPNGILQSQKVIYHNKKNGTACCWYNTSKVMFIEEYENDKLLKGTYFRLGESEPVTRVDNGCGIATIFDKKGVFIKKVHYEKGSPVESSN